MKPANLTAQLAAAETELPDFKLVLSKPSAWAAWTRRAAGR